MSKEAMKQWLVALELAQDNLRPHGDNCFLHNEGEYNRCFCGKDSLSNFLQEQVESLSEAIEEIEKQEQDEPVAWIEHHKGGDNLNWEEVNHPYAKATPLYTKPQPSQKQEQGEPVAARFELYHHIVLKLAEAGCKLSEQQKMVLCNLKAVTKPQPSQKPLTDEQVWKIVEGSSVGYLEVRAIETAIEAAHGIKEKNT